MRVFGVLYFLGASLVIGAAPSGERGKQYQGKQAVFLLAGDSTTATQSANGGGWGDGFKNFTLEAPSFAINYGHDGATTSSFISGGDWANVLEQVETYAPNSTVYVTIQFGHNDMKLANYTETFEANLRRMVADVKERGGEPVIVTPLSRRIFNTNGTIADTLGPWAGYAISVAEGTKTHYINLWNSSLYYLEQVGEPAARRLDLKPGDSTHLNANGSIVFGRMVSDLLVREINKIQEFTELDKTLSYQIWHGPHERNALLLVDSPDSYRSTVQKVGSTN